MLINVLFPELKSTFKPTLLKQLFSPLIRGESYHQFVTRLRTTATVIIDCNLQWKEGKEDCGHANFIVLDNVNRAAYLVDSNGSSLERNIDWLDGLSSAIANHPGLKTANRAQ